MYSILFAAAFTVSVAALNNGVGKLPFLGYDTWNAFACDYDADKVLAQAQAMKKHGLVDAGYKHIILDDCFTLRNRSKDGKLVEDPDKFPDGIKAFNKQLNKLGINGAAYSDAGYQTCAGYPGAYGHEAQDLATWAEWGFDYVKYDNCYIPFDNVTQQNVKGRYQRMADAIADRAAKTHSTPFWLGLCEWGWQQPWIWGKTVGQSWRINGDIKPWWDALAAIIDLTSFQYWASDFYGHNDLDMLEVGNTGQGNPIGNLTYEEAKSHFTAWALLKSPLIIGTDLTNATDQTIEILGNRDLIKINQDPHVGQSISPFRWGIGPDYVSNSTHPAQYWSGPSSYGTVFMILNTEDQPATMFFNLTESWDIRAGRVYSVYDMWSHQHTGTALRNLTLELPAHGVAALLLNDAGPETGEETEELPYCAGYWQCSYPNGTYYSN
ncbi:alpha-galactosidase [Lophium mytilinum]|uniref:Alpha-galactosidase n=1 Tax=Lophium mytilinum TaxID=390894 RepID=A0A6A6R1G4_9PEZI|nr:alpha-galactosidase [Lophium mytilinum]